mmetsp:Transcript_23820/g.67466  ORF Transcript_23820/g.67466 Transcript_23820/m.67466 type:complete len:351 (-) Transcript_23820:167-1219(-)
MSARGEEDQARLDTIQRKQGSARGNLNVDFELDEPKRLPLLTARGRHPRHAHTALLRSSWQLRRHGLLDGGARRRKRGRPRSQARDPHSAAHTAVLGAAGGGRGLGLHHPKDLLLLLLALQRPRASMRHSSCGFLLISSCSGNCHRFDVVVDVGGPQPAKIRQVGKVGRCEAVGKAVLVARPSDKLRRTVGNRSGGDGDLQHGARVGLAGVLGPLLANTVAPGVCQADLVEPDVAIGGIWSRSNQGGAMNRVRRDPGSTERDGLRHKGGGYGHLGSVVDDFGEHGGAHQLVLAVGREHVDAGPLPRAGVQLELRGGAGLEELEAPAIAREALVAHPLDGQRSGRQIDGER